MKLQLNQKDWDDNSRMLNLCTKLKISHSVIYMTQMVKSYNSKQNNGTRKKQTYQSSLFSILILLIFSCKSDDHSAEKDELPVHPNFILVLADDQGWNGTSEMMSSENGSEVITMKLQTLSCFLKEVCGFPMLASAPVCAPSDTVFSLVNRQLDFH